MYLILTGVFLMWLLVYLFSCIDRDLHIEISHTGCMVWTLVNVICGIVFRIYSDSSVMSLLAVFYFVTASLIDFYTGYIYTIHSIFFILLLVLYFLFTGVPGDCHLFLIFYLYLKTLELYGAYGGGDTDYLFCLYIFNTAAAGDAAVFLTNGTLFAAVVIHTAVYHDRKKEMLPFTPVLLAAAVLVFLFYLGRSRCNGHI